MLCFYLTLVIFLSTISCVLSINQFSSKEEYNMICNEKNICRLWNANLTLAPNRHLMNVQLSIVLLQIYKNCFTFYEIYLHKMWPQYFNHCDLFKSTRISLLNLSNNPKQVLSGAFNGLKNGNYCIVILPCKNINTRGKSTNACCDNWALHSDIIHIPKEVEKIKKLKETSSGISAIELISFLTLSIFIISCALTFYFKHKSRDVKQSKKSLEAKIEEEEIVQSLVPKNIIVYILHSQDENTKRKVRLLKDFLTNCASCTVIMIEDILEEIYPDPIVWLNHMLEYKCSRKHNICDSNKRFIIVQSESVLQYIKYKANTISGKRNSIVSISSEIDDTENDWFHYTLSSISIDWSKCLRDYCHLFVVCFDDALCYEDGLVNISPGVHYTIPEHLINLCIDLNRTLSEEQLKKRLSEHPIKHLTEESNLI